MRPAQGGDYGRRISIGRGERSRQYHGHHADVRIETSEPVSGRRGRGHAAGTQPGSFSRIIACTSGQQHRRLGVVAAH